MLNKTAFVLSPFKFPVPAFHTANFFLKPQFILPKIKVIEGIFMKKLLFALGFISFVSLFANAQEKINIDTEYVAEAGSASYEEWTGGYSPEEINTASEIMDIGRRLGRGINTRNLFRTSQARSIREIRPINTERPESTAQQNAVQTSF